MEATTLLSILPVNSAEWIFQLTLHMNTLTNSWCNIMRVTNTDSVVAALGFRVPSINVYNDVLQFMNSVNGNPTQEDDYRGLTWNTTYNIEIHQRYKSAGVYRYHVIVNGEKVLSMDNHQAYQYYNVKIWVSDPNPCDAKISNFKFTHFL